jgi:hypothetical protein
MTSRGIEAAAVRPDDFEFYRGYIARAAVRTEDHAFRWTCYYWNKARAEIDGWPDAAAPEIPRRKLTWLSWSYFLRRLRPTSMPTTPLLHSIKNLISTRCSTVIPSGASSPVRQKTIRTRSRDYYIRASGLIATRRSHRCEDELLREASGAGRRRNHPQVP